MTRHINIAVLTPSQIVFEGLSLILRKLDNINVTIHRAEIADIPALITATKVSAVIIDGLCGHIEEIEELHANSYDNTTSFILFSAIKPPLSVERNFDAVINLYDTDTRIRESVMSVIRNTRMSENTTELTARERQIVVGVVKGLSNKQIAAEINVSVNTVMTHRRNIAAKLQIHSAAGLTIYAISAKLVNLDELIKRAE